VTGVTEVEVVDVGVVDVGVESSCVARAGATDDGSRN
jgi:hypothetical protein